MTLSITRLTELLRFERAAPLWRAAAKVTPRGAPRPQKPWLTVLLTLASLWGANVARAQTMVGLGTLPGASINSRSIAYGVSADGVTVVGSSDNGFGAGEAFVLNLTPPDPAEQIADLKLSVQA